MLILCTGANLFAASLVGPVQRAVKVLRLPAPEGM